MRRLPFGVWLTLASLGLVLLVVAGLVPAGLVLFRRMAAENARARVELSAVAALEALRAHAEEARTGARLLSQRPTLQRLVQSGDPLAASTFIRDSRRRGARLRRHRTRRQAASVCPRT